MPLVYPDGAPAGVGLFVATRFAEEYAREHGWTVLRGPVDAAHTGAGRTATMTDDCAFCGRATEGAWVALRLYYGPGLTIGEVALNVCHAHLEALRQANESDERMIPECRITRWEPGTAGARG